MPSRHRPAHDDRVFATSVTVVCPLPFCDRTKVVTPSRSNDPRFPGEYCDGPEKDHRHTLKLMLGPEGKAYA